jgi:F0F1-type ATP synthase delta subunit
MKYSAETYAKAFLDVIEHAGGRERGGVIERFLAVITKNGDAPREGQILAAVERESVRRQGGRMVLIETARASAEKQAHRIASLFKKPDHVEIRVNPELVAGVRVTIDGERELDLSFAGKLKRLFVN